MLEKHINRNLLEVEEVVKTYSNGYLAVRGVSFNMKKGECLGLVGESGSGKSTVARCILMVEKIDSGKIWLNGEEISSMKKQKLREKQKTMQAVFQNPSASLNPKLKIIDSLMEPLDYQREVEPSFLKCIRGNRRKSAEELLKMVKVPSRYLDLYPHELSGGQKQRIVIARAISIEPSLIILDEPTASLDVSIQATVLNLLKELQENLQLSYFFISHDLSAVNFMCNQILVMEKGLIVDKFTREQLFSKERHSYTKQLLDIFEDSIQKL